MLGECVGPFRVESELGRGAMGSVYLARVVEPHDGLPEGAVVALKVLHPHVVAQSRAVERLQREAELGGRVRHPNVVSFFDSGVVEGQDGPRWYLAMEYVEGRTLRELLDGLGRVPEALLREIARQVADGLAAIHEAGAVHRDLKPENILITPEDDVRIMDLGMVRLQDESLAVTGEGEFSGSLRYAAPELFRGEHAGPLSDLYSLGVLVYELATGESPFAGRTPVDVITAHLSRSPPALRTRVPSTSPFLCTLVTSLLSKDAAERPDSAAELCRILREGERSAWWRGRAGSGDTAECELPDVPVSRRTPLRGRETEMNALRAAWARALTGRGGAVLLVGEAGIGKSRLVHSLVHELEGTEVHVVYGAYSSDGRPGGLTSGLRRIVRAAGGPVAGLERVLGEQSALAAPLAAALGFGSDAEPSPMLRGTALHGVLARVVDGLARERPVLWVVEDVHDAGPGSLALLHTLAGAAVGRRVLLLVTARPSPGEDSFSTLPEGSRPLRMDVPRLRPEHVASLLVDLCDDFDAAVRVAPAIAERSAGVPLFVVALWDELADRGGLDEHAGGLEDLPRPDAIRDVLLARIRVLHEPERALLEAAAVQGYAFDPELVAHAAGEPRMAVLRRLADVEHRTRLVQPAGGLFRFDHRELRDVLLEEMDGDRRLALHTALAEARAARDGAHGALSGEAAYFVVRHHLLGRRPEEATPHVSAALAHLRRGYRHEAALDVCRALLATPGLLEPARAARVHLEVAAHLSHLGRTEEQRHALDDALRCAHEADDRDLAVGALSRIGALLVASGRPLEAVGLLEEAVAVARDGPPERSARLAIGLGTAFHRLGRLEEARARFREALDTALEVGDRELEGTAAGALGNVSADLGVPKTAERLQRRALEIARERRDLEAECRAAGNLGITLVGLGRRDEALSILERQRELTLATGDRRVVGKCELNLANVHRASGRTDLARACFERALTAYEEVGDRQGLGMALGNLGQMLVALGDLEAARDALERALAAFDDVGAERDRGYALVSLAALERRHGDASKARLLYERSLACHEATRCVPGIAEATLGLGVLAIERGDVEAGREMLARCLDVSTERGLWDTAVLAALHDARAGGDVPRALELLARHGETLEVSARPEAHFVAWEVSGKARYLRTARAALDALVAAAAPGNRDAIERVELHRRIRSAEPDPDRSRSPPVRSPA